MKKSISTPVLTVLCTMILPACTSTPPSSNTLIVPTTDNSYLMARGMWKDPNTGLIWDRCNAFGLRCLPNTLLAITNSTHISLIRTTKICDIRFNATVT